MVNILGVSNNKPSYNTLPLFILCVVSGVFFSVTESAILGIATTIAICIAVFFVDEEESFIFIFGLQFLRAVIPFTIGSSALGFIIFAYAVLLLKHISNNKTIDIESLVLGLILILDIWVSYLNGVMKIGDNINWVGSYIYMIYIIKHKLNTINFEKLLVYFCIAEWAICIINILAELELFGQSMIPTLYGTYNDGQYVTFGIAYPSIAGGNGIAFNNIFAICLCILQLRYTQKKALRTFFIISIFFFAYSGLMVISRAFYVEFLIFVVLYLLSSTNKPFRFVLALMVIFILLGFFWITLYDYVMPVLESVAERFEAGNANREELINKAIELFQNNKLIALVGAGSYYPDIYKFTAHNIFFDSLVSLGIFGFCAYWGIIIGLILNVIKRFSFKLGAYIPLVMLFAYKIISGSTRDIGFYYFIIMAVLYVLEYNRRSEVKNCVETNQL